MAYLTQRLIANQADPNLFCKSGDSITFIMTPLDDIPYPYMNDLTAKLRVKNNLLMPLIFPDLIISEQIINLLLPPTDYVEELPSQPQ